MIKILWNNLTKCMEQINVNKINCKLHNVKNINMIDSKFIPDKIAEYIRDTIIYKYVISYNYKNYIINLDYFCSEKINNIIIFETIIRRTIFMMIISNTYKSLNIELYDTPFKKTFNCNNHKKCGLLSPNNVNSGVSYLNNIVIFRKEEMLKLLIHELIHALDIDNKFETSQDIIKILELFNINNSKLLVNESYVETWAIIINIFLVLYEKKTKGTKEHKIMLFKKYIKKEVVHSLQQCSKLCMFYNIDDFNKIYRKNKDTIKYVDGVNTFSYHIIKTINLNNINNFMKNFCDNVYVLPKKYNFNRYILFIIKYNKTIIDKINYILRHTKKNKDLKSLTMSVVN